MNEELLKRIDELEKKFKSLEASASIPKSVEDALRERFRLEIISSISTSAKSSVSESQSVDEAGSATYGVLKNPDAFLQVTIGGTIYYLSAWT